MLNITVTFQETVIENTTTIDEDAVNITVVQKNGKDGADGADGSDANVTSENIATALGYTPADSDDVLTPVPANAVFTDTVYDDTALAQRVTDVETSLGDIDTALDTINGQII
jgi:hypothetical protein